MSKPFRIRQSSTGAEYEIADLETYKASAYGDDPNWLIVSGPHRETGSLDFLDGYVSAPPPEVDANEIPEDDAPADDSVCGDADSDIPALAVELNEDNPLMNLLRGSKAKK